MAWVSLVQNLTTCSEQIYLFPSLQNNKYKKVLLSFLMSVQLFLSLLLSYMHSTACMHMQGKKKRKRRKPIQVFCGKRPTMWWLRILCSWVMKICSVVFQLLLFLCAFQGKSRNFTGICPSTWNPLVYLDYNNFWRTMDKMGKEVGCEKSVFPTMLVSPWINQIWFGFVSGRVSYCFFNIKKPLNNKTKQKGSIHQERFLYCPGTVRNKRSSSLREDELDDF